MCDLMIITLMGSDARVHEAVGAQVLDLRPIEHRTETRHVGWENQLGAHIRLGGSCK